MLIVVFWCSLSLILYTWIIYPFLLYILSKFATENELNDNIFPSVSIIVPVFNQADRIDIKIQNLLDLEYPRGKVEIIVASDGSTDGTVERVKALYPNVNALAYPRVGKTTVQNKSVNRAKGEIIVFTDVDSLLENDALRKIVSFFGNEKIGCVASRVKWINQSGTAVTEGGGFYWKYEQKLWKWESKIGALAWGPGTCMAIRRSLFKPIPPFFGEDSVVPLDVVEQGFLVKYQQDAIVYDTWTEDPLTEFKARVRMTLRSFSGTIAKPYLISPLRNLKYAWSIWSHKLFRWLTPYFALALFTSNLTIIHISIFYYILFLLQCAFYITGLIGIVLILTGKRIFLISHVGSFLLVLIGFAFAIFQSLKGKRIQLYKPVGSLNK